MRSRFEISPLQRRRSRPLKSPTVRSASPSTSLIPAIHALQLVIGAARHHEQRRHRLNTHADTSSPQRASASAAVT